MKKKLVQIMCMVMVSAFLLTGCGEAATSSENTSTAGETTSEAENIVTADNGESVGASTETTEAATTDNAADNFWFGKLEPTGEEASPYPFTRLGQVDGYLPGMLLKDIQVDTFTKYSGNPGNYQKQVEATNYEEISIQSFEDVSYYCTALNWEGVEKETCLVEFVLKNAEGDRVETSVEQALADGNYLVIHNVSSISGLDGSYLGLDSGLRGTELMDAVIEAWGMPSKVFVPADLESYIGYPCQVYLEYDFGEYNVELRVLCDGDTAALCTIEVQGVNQKYKWARALECVEWQP